MSYQAIGRGSAANDGTGDDLRTGAGKVNANFTELYTKLGDGSSLTSDSFVTLTGTQTLTNKTLTTPKINAIEFEGATADAHETTLAVVDPTADRTITLPDATGKVLLDTQIELANGAKISDDSENELLVFGKTASAVNNFTLSNAATGGNASVATSTAPVFSVSGINTNIDMALTPKGAGHITIRSTTGANNQGAIRLNCENNTHGQTIMGQPHSATDSGFFMLPLDGGSARATPNVLLSGAKTVVATQTATGGGSAVALSLNTAHSAIVTSGAQAFTLANGVNGQIKTISMVTDGGDATLTPATLAGGSTITFNDVGDSVVLIYNTTGGWAILSQNGVTVA